MSSFTWSTHCAYASLTIHRAMNSPAPPAGLCAQCLHRKEIRTDRDTIFTQCLRSFTDPKFPKYPRLPVLKCTGFESNR